MDDEDLALLVDLHKHQERQGPGGEAETGRALALAGIPTAAALRIADIGCGTGASALQLARSLDAQVTAVDFLPDFMEILEGRAQAAGLAHKIEPLVCPMEQLPFADGAFDVLWSEGAIYNMGFETGVRAWRRFLKPGGLLVVSEITWLTQTRPPALQDYWDAQYAEIATASEKIRLLEETGYIPVGYFVLPETCWLDNYYGPLQHSFDGFLARHAGNEKAAALIAAEKEEIAFYETYKAYYSYGMYIVRKQDAP